MLRQNIRVLLLKGAALATTVYPSFAARPMGDVDILVRPEEATRAWQLLVDSGWRPELSGGEQFFEGHHHLVGLVDPMGLNLVLEVHRRMLPSTGPFLLDETEVWRDARAVMLGSSEAWVPSDQHQLLHLCVHFAWSHMFIAGIGRTVRDVATLLERGEVDWDGFIALARRTRAASCAYWTLAMSRTLAEARVPDDSPEIAPAARAHGAGERAGARPDHVCAPRRLPLHSPLAKHVERGDPAGRLRARPCPALASRARRSWERSMSATGRAGWRDSGRT